MIKKILIILGALTDLLGATSVIRSIVSFWQISFKAITVRVYKSVVPKRFSGKTLFKDANDIWVLGKNNFERFWRLPFMLRADVETQKTIRFCLAGSCYEL
jgi:hypothetical protein